MRLQELIDLAAQQGIDPKDLPIAVVSDDSFEQEWDFTADIHEATSDDEPSVLVLYAPEAGRSS